MRESSLTRVAGVLSEVADEAMWDPSAEERRLKGAFLTLVAGNPLLDPSTLTLADAERLLGKRLANRDKPGFAAWFLNRDENRQRLEYLFAIALNAAEDILCSTDPKAQGARVSMVRTIAELAGKMPSRAGEAAPVDVKAAVKSIATMDKQQLQAFIEKNGTRTAIQLTGSNEPSGTNLADSALDNEPKKE